jgi:hypothetical protein
VAGEEDTKEIVDLTLVPVGTIKQASDTWDGRSLIGVGLDTDSGVVADRKELVDDLEAVLAGREIGSSDGGDLGELGGGVVWG